MRIGSTYVQQGMRSSRHGGWRGPDHPLKLFRSRHGDGLLVAEATQSSYGDRFGAVRGTRMCPDRPWMRAWSRASRHQCPLIGLKWTWLGILHKSAPSGEARQGSNPTNIRIVGRGDRLFATEVRADNLLDVRLAPKERRPLSKYDPSRRANTEVGAPFSSTGNWDSLYSELRSTPG